MRCRTISSLTLRTPKERAHLFYRDHNPGMFRACVGNEDQMLGSEDLSCRREPQMDLNIRQS